MDDVLSALDGTFLQLEEQNSGALMSIGGVMVFDPLPGGGTPTVEQVCSGVATRLTRLPRYTQRLSSPRTGGLAWPRWVTDERFELRDHITHVALPAPGGGAELCDWAADYYSHPLDRSRPLWEMALVEGLEAGRWALAHKTHHCLVDGVGSVDVAQLLLDREPSPSSRAPEPLPAIRAGELLAEAAPGPLQPVLQAADAFAHAAHGGLQAALHPRQAIERSLSVLDLLMRDEVIAAPRTSLNLPIGSTRRYAVVTATVDELKTIRARLGGSVNDVVLAACTSGLRALLLERDEQPPRRGLRAMVPVDVRASAEHLALGNRISSLFVELPVAEPVASERYRRIVQATARLKASAAASGASMVLDVAALAPPVVHALLARSLYATRLFNVTITNVPGPQVPLYAFGARLRDVQPVVPLAADHTLGIAVFSYDGRVTFGVIADAESTPDIATAAEGISQGVEELIALSEQVGAG